MDSLEIKLHSLKHICDVLNKSQIPYTLGGSALLYLKGLSKQFNDFDLVLYCSEQNALDALAEYKIIPNKNSGIYLSSFFFHLQFEDVKFDIMGHFGIQNLGQTFYLPYKISEWYGNIPLGELPDWKIAYELMGRKEKALLIEGFLRK